MYYETWEEEYSVVSVNSYTHSKGIMTDEEFQRMEERKAQARWKAKREVALDLVAKNFSIELIAQFSELSAEELTKLAKERNLI